jgi:ATP-dependent protease HslVU (ClpYQ) peptidase subunit
MIGATGLSVYYNILDDYLGSGPKPELKDERSVFKFFVKFWKDLHDRYHFVNDQSDTDSPSPFADLDAEFLVVSSQGLFRVRQILSVSRFDEFCVIGSGSSYAEGSLRILLSSDRVCAREAARRAVEVAVEFDGGSGGLIEVEDLNE